MGSFNDIIAAISTPPGKGGVAVIRMSGEGSLKIAEQVFRPMSNKKIKDYPPRTHIYGEIIYDGQTADDVLLSYFEAGKSYTGEETVEISCHGGILVTRCVLESLFEAGARPAGKGEFTKRAYINGRLSLVKAEAVGNLLEAESIEQIRLSSSASRDRLMSDIQSIRAALTEILSSLYARIDYPDEDLGDFTDSELSQRLEGAISNLDRLISTYRTGRAINEGIKCVICGKPNAGKSTLYNLLIGEDAAIVTDIKGTTRDVLERSCPLGRVMLRIADTAGIRTGEGIDEVEKIGISKSREKLAAAELIIAVFDASLPLDADDEEIIKELSRLSAPKIAILNKSDVKPANDTSLLDDIFDEAVVASCKQKPAEVIEKMTQIVNRLFTDESISVKDDAIVASARQHSALLRARDFLKLSLDALLCGVYQDAVSSDIERALGAIGELDGRGVTDEVVEDIFSKFCVGK